MSSTGVGMAPQGNWVAAIPLRAGKSKILHIFTLRTIFLHKCLKTRLSAGEPVFDIATAPVFELVFEKSEIWREKWVRCPSKGQKVGISLVATKIGRRPGGCGAKK